MFPNIRTFIQYVNTMRSLSLSDPKSSENLSAECIMEGLKIFLLNNKSRFTNIHPLQTNGTVTRAPNGCPCPDIANNHLDKNINEKRAPDFQGCFYFGICRDDCLVLWCGDIEKLNNFHEMLSTSDKKLKVAMKIGGNSICFLDLKILFQTIVWKQLFIVNLLKVTYI